METTQLKTHHIIIKAISNDGDIYCDFAIIEINRERLLDLYNRVKTIYKEGDGYNSYYNVNCPFYIEFFQLGEDDEIYDIFKQLNKKDWSYIDITNRELSKLQTTEDVSINNCLKMQEDGAFWFTGFGKHTGVDYETFLINIKDL